MTIVNVGLSHRFAPAEMLEKLAVPSAELGDVLTRLRTVPSVDEVVVLSTCNRVEIYAAASGPAEQVTQAVAGLMASRGRLRTGEVLRMARTRVGGAAVNHLFSVACGLDSMAVGEDQIVAQIKAAARAATAAETIGPVITGLIDAALRASKRARTQTTIGTEGISLVRSGLDIAAAHLSGLADRQAVILGTGSAGKLAARLLHEAGVARLSVAGRNAARAAEVAAALRAGHLLASDVPAMLAGADLLVTATGAAAPVVAAGPVRAARAQAGSRPLCWRWPDCRGSACSTRPPRPLTHCCSCPPRRRACWPSSAVPTTRSRRPSSGPSTTLRPGPQRSPNGASWPRSTSVAAHRWAP